MDIFLVEIRNRTSHNLLLHSEYWALLKDYCILKDDAL